MSKDKPKNMPKRRKTAGCTPSRFQGYACYAATSLLLVLALFGGYACAQTAQEVEPPLVEGLDHIPVAVADIERASDQYRKLGFTLKPGRAHENGIRNQHIKFPDGTELELISVSEARDPLTAEYLRHLARGDGAAFVGLYAPDMDRLTSRLAAEGKTYTADGGLISFPESDDLRYIFFGQRRRSTTDQPQHFEHPNGAEALIGVWIAADDLAQERRLLTALGATTAAEEVNVPQQLKATVARLPHAELLLLPGSRQLLPGRRIVGATIRTHDLDTLRRVLSENFQNVPQVVTGNDSRSLFIPPADAHGLWLEFRQQP